MSEIQVFAHAATRENPMAGYQSVFKDSITSFSAEAMAEVTAKLTESALSIQDEMAAARQTEGCAVEHEDALHPEGVACGGPSAA